MRKVLQGIQGRVEGHVEPASDVNIEFFIYVGAFLAFVWAALSVLRLPLTWASWLVGLSSGLTWLLSWYAPVSIWIGAVLAMLVVWAVRVEFRDVQRARMEQQGRVKSAAREETMNAAAHPQQEPPETQTEFRWKKPCIALYNK